MNELSLALVQADAVAPPVTVVETDRPIELPVYEGRITPQTWRPKS